MNNDNQSKVLVGCSGFGMAKSKYYSQFQIVEVQDTFYEPPQISTLEKWRAEAPPDFTFAIKAWQVITHFASSPTYRRLKDPISDNDKAACGSFQDSEIVHKAWERTLSCANALGASAVLFQCPASFKPTSKNQRNIRSFFSRLERPKTARLFWEPRGEWEPSTVSSICADTDISHAVDPFVSTCLTPDEPYFRLHGKKGWRYVYTADDLKEIMARVKGLQNAKVFFNNVSMVSDAERFKAMVEHLQSTSTN